MRAILASLGRKTGYLILLFVVWESPAFAQRICGELLIYSKDPVQNDSMKIEAVSDKTWGRFSMHFPDVGNDYHFFRHYGQDWFLDYVDDVGCSEDSVAYANYKISVKSGGNWYNLYFDYRDCNYRDVNDPPLYTGDVRIYFSNTTHKFYADPSLTEDLGNSASVWMYLRGEYDPDPDTSEFENLIPPQNFDVTAVNNMPRLTWSEVTDVCVDHLSIYRSYNYGAFSLLTTVSPSTTSYDDYDIETTYPYYMVQYKMKTVNNWGVESAFSTMDWVRGHWTKPVAWNDSKTDVPQQYALQQNFPNPFNPVTFIRYELPEENHIRMDIYNIHGPKIITLIHSQMSAGYHSIEWNGKDSSGKEVGAGIYLCRMQAGEFVKTQKMTLLP